jgi:cytochrome c551/c552
MAWEVFMKSWRRQHVGWMLVLVLAGSVLLAACAPDSNELIISPALGEQIVARDAGNVIVKAEPTPLPLLADLAPDQVTAGLPEDVLAAFASADATVGEQLYTSQGCFACHSLDPAEVKPGPTWHNLGNTAVSRVPGESPALYLDNSIRNPSAYVVSGFTDGIMPKNYGELLSAEDQAHLIKFILAQDKP